MFFAGYDMSPGGTTGSARCTFPAGNLAGEVAPLTRKTGRWEQAGNHVGVRQAEIGTQDSPEQVRYYDSLRGRVDAWLTQHVGTRYEPFRQALFFVPDVFALVFRLAQDRRVRLIDRLKLWGLAVYILSPVDINLDFILPLGPLDDLALSLFVLNSALSSIPDDLLREHWPGDGDAIDVLRGLTKLLWSFRRPRSRKPRPSPA